MSHKIRCLEVRLRNEQSRILLTKVARVVYLSSKTLFLGGKLYLQDRSKIDLFDVSVTLQEAQRLRVKFLIWHMCKLGRNKEDFKDAWQKHI